MTRRWVVLALAAGAHGLLAATAIAAPVSTSPAPMPTVADASLHVRVAARVRRGRMTMDVAPGDTLRTGDHVELHVEASARAYIYAVQLFPDGSSTVLFPEAGDVVAAPDTAMRIPAAPDEWYELDEVVGVETVYVIASQRPIARVDKVLDEELRAIRRQAAAAPPPGPSGAPRRGLAGAGAARPRARPTRMLNLASRGLRKVIVTAGRTVVETAVPEAGDEFVVASFSFRHED